MVKTNSAGEKKKSNKNPLHLLVQPVVSFTIISDLISRIWTKSGVLSMAQSCERADGESRRPGTLLEQISGGEKVCNVVGGIGRA